MHDLPIDSVIPRIRAALGHSHGLVLQAPPGAGKTTRVPLALLDEPWLRGQRILMLEPRRLAARAAASRMAATLGEQPGESVGWRIRFESRVGPKTRIEVVTEGILNRMIQDDPSLDGVGLVIFDEFHERSLFADLGLALTLECRQGLRDDLKLVVMSATLDGGPVARLMGDVPVVSSEGRAFPVETRFLARPEPRRFADEVTAAVARALDDDQGDVLVFLPGAGEIRRVESLLGEHPAARGGQHDALLPLLDFGAAVRILGLVLHFLLGHADALLPGAALPSEVRDGQHQHGEHHVAVEREDRALEEIEGMAQGQLQGGQQRRQPGLQD